MPARPYCLLPTHFEPEHLATLNCRGGGHIHLSHEELRLHRDLRLIETENDSAGNPHIVWLREPDPQRHVRGVVRISRRLSLRGLSCQLGETLVLALRSRQGWALAMLEQIRGRVDRRESAAG